MKKETFLKELVDFQERFKSLKPELEVTVRDPSIGLEGFVVVWSTLAAKNSPLGRYGKGGTRITPTTSLQEISNLALTMTLKNAAAGLPLGGAKSGIRADSDSADFQKVYCRFLELIKPFLRENGGIFGGLGFDVGAKPEHARWACETLCSTNSFTGKPIEMGGTDYDREGIAGFGVATAAKVLLEFKNIELKSCNYAVQGLGAMGAAVVRFFSEFGANLRTISDPKLEGTYRLKTAATKELINSISRQDFQKTKELLKTIPHEKFNLDQVLYDQNEVLFPCAMQDQVTLENVEQIKADFIVEGANSPCSTEARSVLYNKGVLVIPDFVANPGGIIAAYVEMTSQVSIEENIKTKAKVKEALKLTQEKITDNVKNMLNLSESLGVEPEQAALYHALKNIFN